MVQIESHLILCRSCYPQRR
jgi:hypothetical protein